MEDITTVRVLIVDDELSIRKLIKAICMGLGMRRLAEAADGREALNMLSKPPQLGDEGGSKRSFDLVISDWNMPNVNGLDLLKETRAKRLTKNIPFILLTAEAEKENIVAAISAGVTDYIVKPFTSEDLQDKIHKALKISKKR